MAFPKITQKTTLDSQIVVGDKPVCNMYATVEVSGAYNINFNIMDAEGWHENEAENMGDVKAFLVSVQEVADDKFKANQSVTPERQDTSELKLNPATEVKEGAE